MTPIIQISWFDLPGNLISQVREGGALPKRAMVHSGSLHQHVKQDYGVMGVGNHYLPPPSTITGEHYTNRMAARSRAESFTRQSTKELIHWTLGLKWDAGL